MRSRATRARIKHASEPGAYEFANVGPDVVLVRACRQLLKHWDHPLRLTENALVRVLAARGLNVQSSEAIQTRLSRAIQALPGRERAILQRCDLLHEVHSDVHRSLGISRRQFYRERTLGIEKVTRLLLVEHEEGNATVSEEANGALLRLSEAQALEQLGRWLEAVDLLEGLLADDLPDSTRIKSLCRLVQVHARAGRPSLAHSYLSSARAVLGGVTGGSAVSLAITDTAEAELKLATGLDADAESACRRAIPVLRQHATSGLDAGVSESLAQALIIKSQVALEHGQFAEFASAAGEAHDALARIERPNRVVAHEVDVAVAYTRVLEGSDLQRAERELWKCYSDAVNQALLRQAVAVTCYLARFYTRAGLLERSLGIAAEVLPLARSVVRGEPLAVLLLEASEAAYLLGDREGASRYVAEARQAVDQGRLGVHVDLAAAHIHLAEGRLKEALSLAEFAERGLLMMKRMRYVGSALRVQAEALARMGETRRALRTAMVAAEVLQHSGTQYARQRISMVISGLAQHRPARIRA